MAARIAKGTDLNNNIDTINTTALVSIKQKQNSK